MKAKIWETKVGGCKLTLTRELEMEYKYTDCIDIQCRPGDIAQNVVNIRPTCEYQTVGGIGGALTDTSACIFDKLDESTKREFIKSYYDTEEGIGYSFGRLTIGSCDFSTCDYTYVEEGDMTLDSFDLGHDRKYVIPMTKMALEYAPDLTLFASPWSPPKYMKTIDSRIGGHLKKEFYGLWAKHFRKYIEACREEGIDIWGVTMQNEGRAWQLWESCLYTPEEEYEFLGYIGRELEGTGVKILCYDHDRERVFERAEKMFEGENGKYCDGIAYHWYSGSHFGDIKNVYHKYPDKLSVASEGCTVLQGIGIKDELEVRQAEKYAKDVIECFSNGTNCYCDWNIILDENNGPHHNRDGRPISADALVYYVSEENKLLYRLAYYYLGHFSKFVRPGAKVIGSSSFTENIETLAFKNTDGSIACILLNRKDTAGRVVLRLDNHICKLDVAPHSIITAVIEK